MRDLSKIRNLILKLKGMVSSEQLDETQKEILWDHIRRLEGVAKRFRQKEMSKINRKELCSSLAKLADDLMEEFGPKE